MKEIQTAQEEICNLNQTIVKLEQEVQNLRKPGIVNGNCQKKPISNGNNESTNPGRSKQRKICIISSDRSLRILQNINKHSMYNDFQILHYITNSVGIDILLKNLDVKLKEYTKHDYCIIMIGETDFKYSQCFKGLLKNLRDKLEKVTNTNVILTTPTYICGKPLYNYRVEIFNNLLNRDILTYNYGYLIDSNKDLTFDMFSRATGKIRKHGILSIFENIANYILTHIQASKIVPEISHIFFPNITENEITMSEGNNMLFRP